MPRVGPAIGSNVARAAIAGLATAGMAACIGIGDGRFRIMGFATLVADTKSQLAAVLAAPIPFVLVIGLAVLAIWKVVSWHLEGRLVSLKEQVGTLDGRLKLRDEEIDHLKRLAEEAASSRREHAASGGVAAPAEADASDAPAATPGNEIREHDFLLPWRVYIPPAEREFVDFDALVAVLASLDDATSARRAALVKPYMRKWVRIETEVLDVDERDEETCVSSMREITGTRFLWMHFTRDRGALAHLARGDSIKLVGWIEETSRSSIRLYGCERTLG